MHTIGRPLVIRFMDAKHASQPQVLASPRRRGLRSPSKQSKALAESKVPLTKQFLAKLAARSEARAWCMLYEPRRAKAQAHMWQAGEVLMAFRRLD